MTLVSIFDNLHLKARRQSDTGFSQDLLGRLQEALPQSRVLCCLLDKLAKRAARFHDQQVIAKEPTHRTKEGCRSRYAEVPLSKSLRIGNI